MGASSRFIWAVAGLDPIFGCVAADNNCCSSDYNLSSWFRIIKSHYYLGECLSG